MDTLELENLYQESLASFDSILVDAINVSQAVAGRMTDAKPWWASVLFTRLCNTAMSLLVITPRSRLSRDDREHWDFSAIATLARNLVECYFVFFYLAVEPVDEDEWQCRLNLMHLHDCTTRLRMFRDFGSSDVEIKGFEAQVEELRERLQKLHYFNALPEKQQKKFLKGDNAFLLSQDDLLSRMGEEIAPFRGMYRFLSTHVHSFPVSFYRMADQNRGRGLENTVEKGYIATTLSFAKEAIRRATKEMVAIFPDIDPL
jgi:hypothetical protein